MRVHDIYSAIQGEGCLTGTPMILVRFQGCSAACPWCDTGEAQSFEDGHDWDLQEIVAAVLRVCRGEHWILITGGEPLEQDLHDLTQLVKLLQACDLLVALETNGAHDVPRGLFDWACVSPKPHLSLHPNALRHADELKYIIGGEDDIPDVLPLSAGVEICLQPMSQSKEATELCVKTVQERGWRLSLQTHRLIGLP